MFDFEGDHINYEEGITIVQKDVFHFGDYGKNPAEKNVSRSGIFQKKTSSRTLRRKRERILKNRRKRGLN